MPPGSPALDAPAVLTTQVTDVRTMREDVELGRRPERGGRLVELPAVALVRPRRMPTLLASPAIELNQET